MAREAPVSESTRTRGFGDREAFLRRAAARLRDGAPNNPARPLEADPSPPPIRYASTDASPDDQFRQALEVLSGTVAETTDVRADALERCQRRGVRRAAVSRDPEVAGVADDLRAAGIEVVDLADKLAVAGCDIGITGAAYAIANLGSLVVDSGRAGGRTASLLPPHHLAYVRRANLLPDVGHLFRHLDERLPDGLPSNLVLITGPSKSADIELRLTIGMHGPRALEVVFVDEPTG
ncbi:hypothetical protein FTX61_14975 [Nitriliruptoraceae bacterium ZYF776]|nr:hypothetical protein [Profundirhabdus halotolerans]